MNEINGYCMKCRSTRPMDKAVKGTTKTGRPVTKGVCGACGTKMVRMGGK